MAGAVSGGTVGAAISALVTWRLGRHKPPLEEHEAHRQSFLDQIASAEKRGDTDEANRCRISYERFEEGWRAQRDLRMQIGTKMASDITPQTGEMAEQLRNLLEAAEDFVPGSAFDHMLRGNGYFELGEHSKAVKAYDWAIKLDPAFVIAHLNRGVALRELGKFEEGIQAFDHALALRPDDAGALYHKALCECSLSRPEDALATLARSLQLDPERRAQAQAEGGFQPLREHPRLAEEFRRLASEEDESTKEPT